MVKTAVQRKSNAPVAQGDIERSLAVLAARKQLVSVALNMGWQLAFTVMIPIVIGVRLDDHFNTTPSYTLVALVFAIGGAAVVVSSTIKQVNREQAVSDNDKKGNK